MIPKYNESLYKHENNIFSVNGTKEIPTYTIDFPERGGVCLMQTGTRPIYEIIQANLVNCELQNVIESCVHSNQYAVCSPDSLNELISDFTSLTNLGEIYSATKRMENTWLDLPIEVRECFDSDIKKFIRGFGTDEFNDKVSNGFSEFYKNISKNKSTEIPKPESPKPEIPKSEIPKADEKEVSE